MPRLYIDRTLSNFHASLRDKCQSKRANSDKNCQSGFDHLSLPLEAVDHIHTQTTVEACTHRAAVSVTDKSHLKDGLSVKVNDLCRGGATVLKVGGGQILRAKRAEIFFDPLPAFWPVGGGQNIA